MAAAAGSAIFSANGAMLRPPSTTPYQAWGRAQRMERLQWISIIGPAQLRLPGTGTEQSKNAGGLNVVLPQHRQDGRKVQCGGHRSLVNGGGEYPVQDGFEAGPMGCC